MRLHILSGPGENVAVLTDAWHVVCSCLDAGKPCLTLVVMPGGMVVVVVVVTRTPLLGGAGWKALEVAGVPFIQTSYKHCKGHSDFVMQVGFQSILTD